MLGLAAGLPAPWLPGGRAAGIQNEQPIPAETFFERVRLNHVLDVSGAQWDVESRRFTGGSVILLGYEHTGPVPGDPEGFIAGTVHSYGVGDALFADGFEGTR